MINTDIVINCILLIKGTTGRNEFIVFAGNYDNPRPRGIVMALDSSPNRKSLSF
jgi:glutamate-1-semialdehyde aminotransferase